MIAGVFRRDSLPRFHGSACDAMLAGDTLVTRGSGCLQFFICLYTVHSLRNGYRVYTTGCVASSSLGFPFVTLCTHFFGLARRDRPPKLALTVPFFSLTGSSFRSTVAAASFRKIHKPYARYMRGTQSIYYLQRAKTCGVCSLFRFFPGASMNK